MLILAHGDGSETGELAALEGLGNADSSAVDGEAGGVKPDHARPLHRR